MSDRYDTSSNSENEFQPDSDKKVLLNKLDITDVKEINDIELNLLDKLYDDIPKFIEQDQVLTTKDIFGWHKKWLGNVYAWAGEERSVNLGKGDFQFAAAGQIPRLCNEFDETCLSIYTPCHKMNNEQLIEAIAIVHVEFILIHPFRDGNGRLSRLLLNIMALQANKPELDFSILDENREAYFSAIHIGMERNYEPMKDFMRQVLLDSETAADL